MSETEVKFYSRLVFAIAAFLISISIGATTYNVVDRVYQGHAVVIQSVAPTK
jgi:hypothetical protein